jgi:hypothetical protein
MGKFSNADIGMPIVNSKKSGSDIYGREGKGRKTLQRAGDTYGNWRNRKPLVYGREGEKAEQEVPKKARDTYRKWTKGKPTVYGREGEGSSSRDSSVFSKSGTPEESGIFYNDNVSFDSLNERLGRFRGIVKLVDGVYMAVLDGGASVGVPGERDFSGKKFVKLKGAYKIADKLYNGFEGGEHRLPPGVSRSEVESPDQIYKFLTGKKATRTVKGKGLEATMVLAGLFVFSFVGILLTMQKSRFTGFVVGNLTDSSINTGVVLCILGIIGLLIYRFKFND